VLSGLFVALQAHTDEVHRWATDIEHRAHSPLLAAKIAELWAMTRAAAKKMTGREESLAR
jgi:hypothetical protein